MRSGPGVVQKRDHRVNFVMGARSRFTGGHRAVDIVPRDRGIRVVAYTVPFLSFERAAIRAAGTVKGFGCRPMTEGAANTEAGGRRPKASKEGNRGKWDAVVPRSLWGFERGRRGG